MRTLITGAGQIGTQLAHDLTRDGHEVTILRRGPGSVPGTVVHSGDAGDRDLLRGLTAGVDVIFHCIHSTYSARAWERDLPQRERAVMDVAEERGIPVIFPESVYAFGRGARHLTETTPIAPASPLGQVRARLLGARAAHPARTASVIASDLFGPTAQGATSVVLATMLAPVRAGRTAWVMGDPDVPHAITAIPDVTAAMIAAVPLATVADTRLIAPTPPARSQREIAADAARAIGVAPRPVRRIPRPLLAIAGGFSAMARELHRQQYLWEAPSEMRPGRLETELGLEATPWATTLAQWVSAGAPDQAASTSSTATP